MSLNVLQAIVPAVKMWRVLLCIALLSAIALPLLRDHFRDNGKVTLTLELAAGNYARILTQLLDLNGGPDQMEAPAPVQRTAGTLGSASDTLLDPVQLFSLFVFQLGDTQNLDAFDNSPDAGQFSASERQSIMSVTLAVDRKIATRASITTRGPMGERTELLMRAYVEFTARRAAAAASLAVGQAVEAQRVFVNRLVSSFETREEARRTHRIAELEASLAEIGNPITSSVQAPASQVIERSNYASVWTASDDLPAQTAITPQSLQNEIATLRHFKFSSPRLEALMNQRETLATFDPKSLEVPVFRYIGMRLQPGAFAAPLPIWVMLGAVSGLAIGFASLVGLNLARQIRSQIAIRLLEFEGA